MSDPYGYDGSIMELEPDGELPVKLHGVRCDCGYKSKSFDEAVVHKWICLGHKAAEEHESHYVRAKVIVYDNQGDIVLIGHADIVHGEAHMDEKSFRLGPGNLKAARSITFDHSSLEPAQARLVSGISKTAAPIPIETLDPYSYTVQDRRAPLKIKVEWVGAPLKLRRAR